MSEVIIKADKLSKYYKLYDKTSDRLKESLSLTRKKHHKEYYALNDVSFEVKKGENIGIIGANGAGKSTLLKIITGVLSPSSGSFYAKGKISALLELGTGFNPEYTGIENIYLNGTMMGFTKEQIDKKVGFVTDFAGIGDFIYQPVKTYSSGMFARLAFAVAVNVEPEILIVDEALAVGDVRFQIKCMNKMKEMMMGGTTVLFVSHDTNAIRRFCSGAIWLNKGQVQAIGKVNSVVDMYLDYLKLGETEQALQEIKEKQKKESKPKEKRALKPYVHGEGIAEIVDFKILNENLEEVSQIKYDEYLKVVVTYDVYDEKIPHPVLGVALRAADHDYTCGLNTLLDNVEIPWIKGRNTFGIEYPHGLRAVGGKYTFATALFDETATVPINFIGDIKEIEINCPYVGEGRFIINHRWI